MMSDNIILEL